MGHQPALHVAGADSAVYGLDAKHQTVGGDRSDEGIGHGPQARRFDEASDQAEASTADSKDVIAFDTEPAGYKKMVCVIDLHTMSDRKST